MGSSPPAGPNVWDRPGPVATVGQEDEGRGVQLRDALAVTPYGQFSGPVRDYA